MSSETGALGEQLYTILLIPFVTASLRVIFASVSNALLHKVVIDYYDDIRIIWHTALFVTYASIHLYIFHSKLLAIFTIATSLIFEIFFIISIKLSKELHFCTLEAGVKALIFVYTIVCFTILGSRKEIDFTFIVSFIVMTVKMVTVANEFEHMTIEDVDHYYNNADFGCLIGGYVAYPAWITYQDFENMSTRQPRWDNEWKVAMVSAGIRAVHFEILSHKLVPVEVFGNYPHASILQMLIHAFQYRCKYYYLAQIGELETIATGVIRGNSLRHWIFSFYDTETAVTVKDALKSLCLPLNSALDDENIIIVNAFCLISLAAYFDLGFANLLFFFLMTILTQEFAVSASRNFFFCRYFLVVLNQFRMALMFYKLRSISYIFSLSWTGVAIIIDFLIWFLNFFLYRRNEIVTLR